MNKTHYVGFRADDELFNLLNNANGKNSDIVRQAVKQWFNNDNNVEQNDNKNEEENLYQEVYSNCYNQEVLPLKNQIEHLNEILSILKSDKKYLQEQNNALILAKHPLLTRLKMKLLKGSQLG